MFYNPKSSDKIRQILSDLGQFYHFSIDSPFGHILDMLNRSDGLGIAAGSPSFFTALDEGFGPPAVRFLVTLMYGQVWDLLEIQDGLWCLSERGHLLQSFLNNHGTDPTTWPDSFRATHFTRISPVLPS